MKILILSFILILLAVGAQASLIVGEVKGAVFVEGRTGPVRKGEALGQDQTLVGQEPSSRIQLTWESGRVVLSGKFKIQLRNLDQRTKAPSRLSLLYGKIRTQTQKRSKTAPLEIVTPVAVAGVRGTDFMVTYDDLLGEAEIVCFESTVEFSNSATKKSILVGAGQWGGVGLRFGELRDPLTLPANVLKAIGDSIPYLEK